MAGFTIIDGQRNVGDIKMYALSTCAWCKKTKAFFQSHGIRYSFIDVDTLDPQAMVLIKTEQQRFNPRGSFPTIVIDGSDCIVGYDENRLLELIGE